MDVSKFDLSEYSMALPTIEKLSYCKKLSGLDLNSSFSTHLVNRSFDFSFKLSLSRELLIVTSPNFVFSSSIVLFAA